MRRRIPAAVFLLFGLSAAWPDDTHAVDVAFWAPYRVDADTYGLFPLDQKDLADTQGTATFQSLAQLLYALHLARRRRARPGLVRRKQQGLGDGEAKEQDADARVGARSGACDSASLSDQPAGHADGAAPGAFRFAGLAHEAPARRLAAPPAGHPRRFGRGPLWRPAMRQPGSAARRLARSSSAAAAKPWTKPS
jgi:hypothetical protein